MYKKLIFVTLLCILINVYNINNSNLVSIAITSLFSEKHIFGLTQRQLLRATRAIISLYNFALSPMISTYEYRKAKIKSPDFFSKQDRKSENQAAQLFLLGRATACRLLPGSKFIVCCLSNGNTIYPPHGSLFDLEKAVP